MLKRRLIPKMQLKLRQSFRGAQPILVVTRQFSGPKPVGDPVSQAKIYEAQLADELILLDIERTDESWETLLKTVEKMSETLATPLSVGGGIRSFSQVQRLLDRGADKVVINSKALETPGLIDRIALRYGTQCVVVSIDTQPRDGSRWIAFSDSAQRKSRGCAIAWAQEAADRGAGEIMYTSIPRDGTGTGIDLELTRALTTAVNVPVVASGGCGTAQHFVEAYEAGASAVAAGTFFAQRDQNPMQCRSHIKNAGIPIRNSI